MLLNLPTPEQTLYTQLELVNSLLDYIIHKTAESDIYANDDLEFCLNVAQDFVIGAKKEMETLIKETQQRKRVCF